MIVLLNRIKVSVLFLTRANSLLDKMSRCACSNKEGRGGCTSETLLGLVRYDKSVDNCRYRLVYDMCGFY